ncbi:butyrophilin subfamily 1 member A1-like [Lithobates pipiens]
MELIILLLGIIQGLGSVKVVQHPPVLLLSMGESAQMFCNISGDEKLEILHSYWKRRRSQEVTLEKTPRITITPHSLVIFPVTPRDNGLYICSYRDSSLDSYKGNGTHLMITATPVVTLTEDTENHLLICQAERFYSPDLNISWSVPLGEERTHENLTENEDGTFTKVSILNLTKETEGENVACHLVHSTLHTVLYRYDPLSILYVKLFPVRVALVLIVILSLVSFQIYHHRKWKVSQSRKMRAEEREAVAAELSEAASLQTVPGSM